MSARSMICAARRRPAVEPPDQVESVVDADAGWEADARARLEHGADPAVRHCLAWIGAENLDATNLGPHETEQRRNRCRLPRSVRSEQCKHLTLADFQVQPVERNAGAIAMGDALEGQGDGARPAEGLWAGQCCYEGRQEILRRLRPRSGCRLIVPLATSLGHSVRKG